MAGSEHALNKVRSILGKMDRSITDARKRRLGEPDSISHNGIHEEDDLMIGQAEGSPEGSGQRADQPEPVSEMRARYGKAKPIGQADPETSPRPASSPTDRDDENPLGYHARPA